MRAPFMLIKASIIIISLFSNVYASNLKVYTIGNSLTGDTLPRKYASGWHICGGSNLKKIKNNPNCSKNNKTTWDVALTENKYNVISVQPYYGTRLYEDVDAISVWIQLQPSAIFVIHTGWPVVRKAGSSYTKGTFGKMSHTSSYFKNLVRKLKLKFPQTEFRLNPAFISLELILDDIKRKSSPFKSLEELYRDKWHMNEVGKYLMHNLMRNTLQVPNLSKGFSRIPKNIRNYLNNIIVRASIESEKLLNNSEK